MGLTAAPRRVGGLTGRSPRPDGWTIVTVAAAIMVAGPLLVLPASFITGGDALSQFSGLLPAALAATGILMVGVGLGTFALGTSLAALVSFYDFPGRSWLEWALVLPLAMPGYVFTLFVLGVSDSLGGIGTHVRSPLGAVVVFTLVLYPYVYLLARTAFLSQGGTLVDAARGLGLSRGRAIVRVALPLARPAIAGGVALALMESLADFGTVNLLGVQSFPNAIYKVWFGAFDRDAALQLGTILVSITLLLLMLERASRGRARYSEDAGKSGAVRPVRLRGIRAAAALGLPLVLIAGVVGAPLAQLAVWSARSISHDVLPAQLAESARNSLLLACVAVLIVVIAATVLAYGRRVSDTRTSAGAVRVATIGYGLPGSVVAVAVIVPFGWLDHRLDDATGVGLLITGTVLALLAAYAVRFLALAFQAVDSALQRIPGSLDDAARGLGSDRLDILGRVHVPLISSALLTAALLVFTEVMKELPATLLLRPLGGDTLAIEVWHATTESLYETAALPALMIVLVGLLPVAMLIRLSRRVAA
jgi:iron(III) transport system permease protein